MQLWNKIEQACVQVTEAMCREVCHAVVQRLSDCFNHLGQLLPDILYCVILSIQCTVAM